MSMKYVALMPFGGLDPRDLSHPGTVEDPGP